MAKKTTKGGLSSKVKSYVHEHKSDETNYGIVDLPGGIRNGIAQLTDCRFSQYKKGQNEGEYFFLAAGTVIAPDSVQTEDGEVPIKGLRTQIMIPVCSTTKRDGTVIDVGEHVANILNEMRKLGVDTEEMDDDALEETAELLKEQAPYFRFSTTQSDPTDQFPNPRVWENWRGVKGLEDYIPDDADDVTEEEEEEEVDEEEVEEEEVEEEEEQDLNALAELADADDEDAQAQITELAMAAGLDPDEYETWAEVVVSLANQEAAEEEEEEVDTSEAYEDEAEYEEIEPEKEEIYLFNKKECEVTFVSKAKKTVNLKELASGKSHKGIPWTKLSYE